MARLFIDGFETGDSELWDEVSNPSSVVASSIMTGNYCISVGSTTSIQFLKTIPSSTECFFAFTIKPGTLSCEAICSVGNGVTTGFSITRTPDSTGQVHLRTGIDTGLIISSSATSKGIPAGKKSYIVFHVKIGDETTGAISLTCNGKTLISLSNINTTSALSGAITTVILGTTSNKPSQGSFDDIVIDDTEAPIRPRILGFLPNSNGSINEFTSSTGGLNFESINNVPGDESEFIISNIIGAKDTFNIPSLPALLNNVRCIQLSSKAWYEGNATARKMQLLIKTATAETNSSTFNLTQHPAGYSYLIQNDPETDLPFTEETFNALQIGVVTVA